jgi:excisionase family DNA binding protein
MFTPTQEETIRELRGEYKIKWLETIFKDFVKEAIKEFVTEQKKLEELSNPLMKIADISKRFKVSKQTIHNWINRGIITGNKTGKNRYFTEEEVRQALTKYGFSK